MTCEHTLATEDGKCSRGCCTFYTCRECGVTFTMYETITDLRG